MKKLLFLVCFVLVSCQNSSSEYSKFIDFNSFKETDRLTLESDIHDQNDCGEWGGHKERITIQKENGIMQLYYNRMNNLCEFTYPGWRGEPYKAPSSFKLLLNEMDLDTIKAYVKNAYDFQPKKNTSSNAPDYYEVQFTRGRITESFFADDISNSFEAYFNLRSYLYQKVESDQN